MTAIKHRLQLFYNNKQLMFCISLICMLLISTINGLGDWDFVWQSYLGKAILTRGNFYGLNDLIWGTTNVHTYYDHEWLMNVCFYLLTVAFGEVYSIVVVKIVIELLVGVVSYCLLKQFIKNFDNLTTITYLICILLTYCFGALLIKPKAYDISLVFFMCLLIILERRKEGIMPFSRFCVYIIGLTLLWNNIHSGSIVLLVIVTVLYWVLFWRDLKTVILGLICGLLLGLNPYGYSLIYFDIIHAFDKEMKFIIAEWHGLDTNLIVGKIICFFIIIIFLHLLHIKINRDNIHIALLFLLFFIMTISSVRHFLYMYPIGLIIICQGQFERLWSSKEKGVLLYCTCLLCVVTILILAKFATNLSNNSQNYVASYITPELDTVLEKTVKGANDGLFTDDINVWSSGYKSFQSGAFPHTKERILDSYTLLRGSETQIKTIIDYYQLDKFLFYKQQQTDVGYLLNTNLYDYMISRPEEYVLLYDDDIVVYFVTKEVKDAIK